MSKVFLPFKFPEGEEPFIELVLKYLDGNTRRNELDDLNEQLRNSGLKRRIFIEMCREQQLIRELPTHALSDKVTSLWLDEETDAGTLQREATSEDIFTKARRPLREYRQVAAVVACLLTISVVLWAALGLRDTPTLARSVKALATIAESRNAEWDEEHIGLGEGARLSPGMLKLKSGLVRLNTPNGVTLSMEGPAEVNLVSESLIELERGRIVVKVPKDQVGYRVETKMMRIVDLGTAFGVSVNPKGMTEVSVFDGVVEVFEAGKESEGKVLRQGTSMRATPRTRGLDNIPFRSEPFNRAWRMNTGVQSTRGAIEYLRPGLPIDPYIYEDDRFIILFPEKSGVTLERPIAANLIGPGSYTNFGASTESTQIPAGTRVKSFLIQMNPEGSREQASALRGGITFDRPILGVITGIDELVQSDADFGIESVTSRSINRRLGVARSRGLENGEGEVPANDSDLVFISPDQHKISVKLNAGETLDHIRVIVADSE